MDVICLDKDISNEMYHLQRIKSGNFTKKAKVI